MSSSVCIHCGKPDPYICDSCTEIFYDMIEADRRRFQKPLTAGVSREMANRIMIARNSGELPS